MNTEPVIFDHRAHAGRMLAFKLRHYAANPNVVVLALPRGGVPVAFEVARALGAPLDVYVVRKLSAPRYPELAMGAVGSGGAFVINEDVVDALGVPRSELERATARGFAEVAQRERTYRGGGEPPDVRGRIVIVVDDGLATGATMRVAVAALRAREPARIVVAVPVASREAWRQLTAQADEVACVATPEPFYSVGAWYREFGQTSDDHVRALLSRAHLKPPAPQHVEGGR